MNVSVCTVRCEDGDVYICRDHVNPFKDNKLDRSNVLHRGACSGVAAEIKQGDGAGEREEQCCD